MTEQTPEPSVLKPVRAFSRSALPLYSIFFVWGVGTGFQQFGRPLFVASMGVPVFLITLIGSMNSTASLVAAPLTGFLTDRFGRRPIMMIGNCLRGIASGLQFFSTNYVQFAILEIIGTFGVSMFNTGTSIVMADITERENRGRANAIRGMSLRIGSIGGPLLGAALVPLYGLRALFLYNFFTKILILIVMWLRVRETRPEEAKPTAGDAATSSEPPLDMKIFLAPPVIVIALSTLAYSMVGFAGIMGNLFPLHVEQAAGLQHSDVGTMMGLAGAATLAASYPNGMFVDRFGRKKSMALGLFVLACSGFLLARVGDYWSVFVMILVYGLGEGMSQGASEVYAMDLAPTRGRGAFLGVWATFRNVSGILSPLIIGAVAQNQGLPAAFTIVASVLALCGVLITIFGREPGSVRRAEVTT